MAGFFAFVGAGQKGINRQAWLDWIAKRLEQNEIKEGPAKSRCDHPDRRIEAGRQAGLELLSSQTDDLADFAATMTGVLFYLPVVVAWTLTLFFTGLFGWRLIRWTGRTFFAWPAVSAEKATGSIQS